MSSRVATDVAISVQGLRMSYGANEVLHGIDLSVRTGEVFALLGPNGAGKTTTIEILEGFRTASAGKAVVLGADPRHATSAWRERIGMVMQLSVPEPDLSARETLELYAGFYAHPLSVERVLSLCGLTEQADVRNRRLSGGQQRRLDVALALVGDPELLFLDEPTTGFDPAARHAAWDMIAGLRRSGTTIVLTTHYLEEAEFLADRIAVIDGGRIVGEGTPQTLGGRDHASTIISFRRPRLEVPLAVQPLDNGRVELSTAAPTETLRVLTTWAADYDLELEDLEVHRPSLENVYLQLTNGTVTP